MKKLIILLILIIPFVTSSLDYTVYITSGGGYSSNSTIQSNIYLFNVKNYDLKITLNLYKFIVLYYKL